MAVEIFKVKANIAPVVMKDIFEIVQIRIHSHMRLTLNPVTPRRLNIEIVIFVGTKKWNSIPYKLKFCLPLRSSKLKSDAANQKATLRNFVKLMFNM